MEYRPATAIWRSPGGGGPSRRKMVDLGGSQGSANSYLAPEERDTFAHRIAEKPNASSERSSSPLDSSRKRQNTELCTSYSLLSPQSAETVIYNYNWRDPSASQRTIDSGYSSLEIRLPKQKNSCFRIGPVLFRIHQVKEEGTAFDVEIVNPRELTLTIDDQEHVSSKHIVLLNVNSNSVINLYDAESKLANIRGLSSSKRSRNLVVDAVPELAVAECLATANPDMLIYRPSGVITFSNPKEASLEKKITSLDLSVQLQSFSDGVLQLSVADYQGQKQKLISLDSEQSSVDVPELGLRFSLVPQYHFSSSLNLVSVKIDRLNG